MFASAVRLAPRVGRTQICKVAPRVTSSQGVRFMSLSGELKKKESVEEAKYMREQEAKFLELKRAERAAEATANEMAVYEEVVAPAMVECQEMLAGTGDKVSAEGLELLAKWKLGVKN